MELNCAALSHLSRSATELEHHTTMTSFVSHQTEIHLACAAQDPASASRRLDFASIRPRDSHNELHNVRSKSGFEAKLDTQQ